MGYMGLGMRKEVYTRKPKSGLKEYKKLIQRQPLNLKSNVVLKNSSSPNYEMKESMEQYMRHKRYRNLLYLAIGVLVTLIFVMWFSGLLQSNL